MHRLKNWPSRLATLITQAQHRPFEWGAHDCCLWAADDMLACTGVDPAANWRGTYSTAAGAAALLEQLGGVQALVARWLPEIAPVLAGAGDVGLIDMAGRPTLAVHGGQCWLAVGPAGLLPHPVEAATQAWRVQHA